MCCRSICPGPSLPILAGIYISMQEFLGSFRYIYIYIYFLSFFFVVVAYCGVFSLSAISHMGLSRL